MRGGDRTSLGLWGEKQAARYLKKQGFRLLETRFRCREGEIIMRPATKFVGSLEPYIARKDR